MREINEKMSPENNLQELQEQEQQYIDNNCEILDLLIQICTNQKYEHVLKFKAIEWIQQYLKILLAEFEQYSS